MFDFLEETNRKLAGLNSLKFSVWTSRGAGLVLAYDGGLILLPMLRNCLRVFRPFLSRVLPVDENIWFHKQVAYSMAFWAAVHTTAHYINFIKVERTRKQAHSVLTVSDHHHRNSSGDCSADSLHAAWWHYWTFHAPYHVLNVYHCAPQGQKTVL